MTKLNMYVALNFVYLNSTLNTTQCQQEYTMNLRECFARIMTKNFDQEFHKNLNVLRIYSFRGR
jgi:hypothetical protein